MLAGVLIGLIAALAVADRRGWLIYPGGPMTRYDGRAFRVREVIDGQTLEVVDPDRPRQVLRVRLWGVGAPPLLPFARSDSVHSAEPWPQRAVELIERLAQGQMVRLRLEPQRVWDDQDRLLAFVELPDGSLLNERLLAEGLARLEDRWEHHHQERFRLLQMQAQREGLGVWAR